MRFRRNKIASVLVIVVVVHLVLMMLLVTSFPVTLGLNMMSYFFIYCLIVCLASSMWFAFQKS